MAQLSGAVWNHQAGQGTSYRYTSDGQLTDVTQVNTNVTTRYIPDYTTGLPTMLSDGTTNIVYGRGNERLQAVTAGVATWYTHDHLGNTRQTVTETGTVVGSARYDAWGVALENTTGSRFGYTGELTDNGLVYLRARWYNPSTGTFTSRDPFPGVDRVPQSLHPYAYTHNNPVNATDPSGKCIPWIDPTCRPFWESGVTYTGWEDFQDYSADVVSGMGLPGAMIADAFTGGHATQRIVAEGGIGTRLGAVFTGVALGGAAWRYGPAAWRAANDALSAPMIRGQHWLTQNPGAARWLLGATGLAELSDDILLRMAALCGDTTSQGFVQLGLSAGPSPLGDLLVAGMILSSRPGRFLAPDGGGGGGVTDRTRSFISLGRGYEDYLRWWKDGRASPIFEGTNVGDVQTFPSYFHDTASRVDDIYFDVQDVSVQKAFIQKDQIRTNEKSKREGYGFTAWELYTVLNNKEYFNKVILHRGGVPLTGEEKIELFFDALNQGWLIP
jgi:RHS repeat-associated protein